MPAPNPPGGARPRRSARPDGPVRHRLVERLDRHGRALIGATVVSLLLVALTLTAATVGLIGPPDGAGTRANAATMAYRDAGRPVPERVADLLARMSTDDKIGQLVQVDHGALSNAADVGAYRIGSVRSDGGWAPEDNSAVGWAQAYDSVQRTALETPLAIPVIYGVDAVHGHNFVHGATIFPHNVGLGASRDPALAQRIGRATAEEIAGTGINWAFAPCLCQTSEAGAVGGVGGYESFGERLEVTAPMASMIAGLQGPNVGEPASVLATVKHRIGPGELTEERLGSVHLPPLHAAVSNGVGAVMLSFADWSGTRPQAHRRLVTEMVKGQLGFTGFVVSDSTGLDRIDGVDGLTGPEIATAINAGIDMVSVPTGYPEFLSLLRAEVATGGISTQRLDDANTRILTRKFELGLFERSLSDPAMLGNVGSQAHRDLAREAVRGSQVLLRNVGGALPLAKSGGKIFVAGKSADDIGNQTGGVTISREGASGGVTAGTTILGGIRDVVGAGATVTYDRDGAGIDRTYRAAIAVVGEVPYADGAAETPTLDATDTKMLDRLKAADVPVIVVLVSGRPLDVADRIDDWAALVAAWLPGTEGGGVADVLFGDHTPTAKLPVTWPAGSAQQQASSGGAELFPYGFGLSFSGAPTPTPAPGPTGAAPRPTTARPPANRPTSAAPTPTQTTPAAPPPAPPTSAGPTPTPTPSASLAPGVASCAVRYSVVSQWSDGFVAEVRVTAGNAPVTGWTMRFALPDGQRVVNGWNAGVTQAGANVTAANPSWLATIPAGGQASFGFQATHDGTNGPPDRMTFNGAACTS